jgi:glycosyltransferase involved in cell wall biosynthesis
MIPSRLPKVTVLMPVFNGEAFLDEAIESILSQTFTDFEFLIIDDGSIDKSVNIVRSYNDHRIKLVCNNKNLGLVATLNRGIELSSGTYIARMDCDDVSLPERLEKQIDFMESHPDVGVCSSWIEVLGKVPKQVWKYPVKSEEIKCWLIFESVLPHPSAVIRTKTFKERKLFYDSSFPHAEDFELWVRAGKYLSYANIDEVLLLYRLHANNVGVIHRNEKKSSAARIRNIQLSNLGITPDLDEMDTHEKISTWKFGTDKLFVEQAESWLCKLKEANSITNMYKESEFTLVLAERWIATCNASTSKGYWMLKKFYSSPLVEFAKLRMYERIVFFLKCMYGMVRSLWKIQ